MNFDSAKFSAFTQNLELKENGIWFSRSIGAVSYPHDGNERCFQIEDGSYWFQHRNQCILTVIRNFPPPDGILFDVGGGNGYVALGVQQSGFNVVLMEPGVQGAQNARNRGVEFVICSSLEDSGIPANSVPSIGIFDVIEHIKEDAEFLKSIHQYLAPQGRLYLTTPAYEFLRSFDDDNAQHFRRYSLRSLNRKLTQAGFSVLFQTYIFAFLPLPILLFRTLPSKWKTDYEVSEQDEHRHPSGLIGKGLSMLLKGELACLQKKVSIPFGGSCLVVAKKTQ